MTSDAPKDPDVMGAAPAPAGAVSPDEQGRVAAYAQDSVFAVLGQLVFENADMKARLRVLSERNTAIPPDHAGK